MIVFMDEPNFIPWLHSQFPNRDVVVFNLSSLYSGYPDVSDLITKIAPINFTGLPMPEFVNSPQFDFQYMNSIINTPNLFSQLMKIVGCTYEGQTVVILVQRDPYRDAVMESIIKIIQQRYGYNCWIVEDVEDIGCLYEPTFTPMGLLTLDHDLKVFDDYVSKGVTNPVVNTNLNIE